ncbi:SDR family NAD(P)-dependent oxidoreductase [Microbulbifer sp. ZKSA006]|uniref:SDR family NAD(P)-dependent oxidoreductase n=1 Tax=Microbulbifer sp. ZKSA006 TaxID=3243390 RepID=UPI00403972B2
MLKVNLIAHLSEQAQKDQGIVFYFSGNKRQSFGYRQLYVEACRTLASLQARNLPEGQTVILQLSNQRDFLVAFWACLIGQYIPVPLAAGLNTDSRNRVLRIFAQLDGALLIGDGEYLEKLTAALPADHPIIERTLIIEALNQGSGVPLVAEIAAETTAFIQFSSGSTGNPKGIVLSHQNLLTNIQAIGLALNAQPFEKTLSWLPLTHDMGLIGFHLVPLVHGWSQVLIDPELFVRRPAIWLDAISSTGATLTASPNFGLKHLLKHFKPNPSVDIDLSSIRLIFNGAEPVNAGVCREFTARLSPLGLAPAAMFPVYGLAEASLAVAFPPAGEALITRRIDRASLSVGQSVQLDKEGMELVDLGEPVANCRIRIVGDNSLECPAGTVGYVQIKGENVSSGYLGIAAVETFTDDGWLDTGDIGFLLDGRLTLVGRSREMLIVNGQNLYPYDLEAIAETLPGVEQTAFVGCDPAGSGDETVVAFVRCKGGEDEFISLKQRLERHMVREAGISLAAVVPLARLPKTSSGKIQRVLLQQRFEAGEFNPGSSVLVELIQIFEQVLSIEKPGLDENFFDLGADSRQILEVQTLLQQRFGAAVGDSTLFSYPTLRKLAQYLSGEAAGAQRKSAGPGCDIAIIGMAGRFPGASNIDKFWQNLTDGVDSISHFSAAELLEAGVAREQLEHPDYVRAKGVLAGAEDFDVEFFNYAPIEAHKLDPQARIMHECAWTALEHAGYDSHTFSGRIGCYVGASPSEAWESRWRRDNDAEAFVDTPLTDKDFLSTRLSYKLNLCGPSVSLYTACSTSLATVATACQALTAGQCDMALAGGVSIMLPVRRGYRYEEGMLFSKDGQNRSFDRDASGSVFSDGAGIVLLKPLQKALLDRDNILAVIKGIAINNDGKGKVGYTAPSVAGQADVISSAQQMAGAQPQDIGYIEAHGSATALGDVIEVEALRQAMPGARQCALGSVKANIGHLNSAAGIAGLIKVVKMLMHRQLPPSLHFDNPNPRINFAEGPFYINTHLTPWDKNLPALAGVSSFGIGGTNVHAVLEAPAPRSAAGEAQQDYLFVLSARSDKALDIRCRELAEYLKQTQAPALGAICHTLQVGRHHFDCRLYFICSGLQDALAYLTGDKVCERAQVLEPFEGISTEESASLEEVGRLWLAGAPIDWCKLALQGDGYRVALPTYPFERQCFSSSPLPADFYSYIPRLVPADVPRGGPVDLSSGVLLIENDSGLAACLQKALQDRGIPVSVHSPGDYDSVLDSLKRNGCLPAAVLHMGVQGTTEIDQFYKSYLDICALLRSLMRHMDTRRCYVRVLARAGSTLSKAAAVGPLKAIQGETGSIFGALITVTWPQGSVEERCLLVEQLVRELSTAIDPTGNVIELQGSRRLVPRYQPVASDIHDSYRFRRLGTYVITGGLGGIGFALAKYLAETVQANLILVGLTALDSDQPGKLSQIKQLQSLGSRVSYRTADVSNSAAMSDIFNEGQELFGHIDGAIHCAGIPGGGLILSDQREQNTRIFDSKVKGTLVLAELLCRHNCDFLLLCSSVASLLNVPGQSAYSAANAFLDEFAHHHKLPCRVRTVNWDHWLNLAHSSFARASMTSLMGEEGLSPAQGIRALTWALGQSQAQVIVCATEFAERQNRIEQIPEQAGFMPAALKSRPNLSVAYAPAQSENQALLIALIEQYVGIADVGIYDNFFELGLKSLDLFQLNQQLSRRLNRPLALTALYANPTIDSYSGYLARSVVEVVSPPAAMPALESGSDDIAIIGMACRFPGAKDVDEFWQNLKGGRESIHFFSEDELLSAGVDAETLADPDYVRAKGVVRDLDRFDYEFFGLSPREAQICSPQLRLSYECIWQALEAGGYPPDSHEQTVGLFFGASHNIAWEKTAMDSSLGAILGQFEATLLSHKEFLASRVAHKLNFNGPVSQQFTGCSTSLVTVHQACRSLLAGECDMAVAGGVSVELPFQSGYLYREGMIFSPDGHCRSFDNGASGSCFGDGVGAVLLKPLRCAVKSGDNIVAVIKGSAINNDGASKVGYTAPSASGQARVIRMAQKAAAVSADTIGYVEGHGSATSMGDPIELEALKAAFATERKQYCYIGSVKSNLGHLNTASGIAGLIKTALAVCHGEIPASLHAHHPTTKFDFRDSPFAVCQQLTPWPEIFAKRRAGVSSFGIGGTNAHLILEQAPETESSPCSGPHLLVLSAKSTESLQGSVDKLADFFTQNPGVNLADVAYTLQVGRSLFNYRRLLICDSVEEALDLLAQSPAASVDIADGQCHISGKGDRVSIFYGAAEPIQQCLDRYQQQCNRPIRVNLLDGKLRRFLPLPTYSFARLSCSAQQPPQPEAPALHSCLYQPSWARVNLPEQNLPETLLIVGDNRALARELTEDGYGSYCSIEELGSLSSASEPIAHIVYCCAQVADMSARMLGVVALLKQLADGSQVRLTLLSQNLYAVRPGEQAQPEDAVLAGLALVINQEYRNISCQLLDFDRRELAQAAGSVLARALSYSGDEVIYAWREGQCWQRQWAPFTDRTKTQRLRKRGVYLITGGFGKVGLALAEGLARQYQARLVLLGRRGSDDEGRVKALGADVLCFAASCSDERQMRQVIEAAEERFGVIHGVIHCAGWADEHSACPVAEINTDFIARHFEAKVHGTRLLGKLFADRSLDFCLLMSSLSATLGGLGLAAYAAANQYMDSVAANSDQRWISVNWDRWETPGSSQNPYLRKVTGGIGLTPAQGFDIFRRIVEHSVPSQLAVAGSNLPEQLAQWARLKPPCHQGGFAGALCRDRLATPFIAPQGALEKRLAEIFADYFGFAEISVCDNFFDLGASSVDLVQLNLLVNRQLAAAVPLAKFLTYTSIQSLAGYLTGNSEVAKECAGKVSSSVAPQQPLEVQENDVAIIGMAGQFPGADNIEQFWQNLRDGIDSVTRYGREELLEAGLPGSLVDHPSFVAARGVLENAMAFDAEFFGYTPREAEAMDPQARVLHECTWHALEYAGYNPQDYPGKISFFAGGGPHPYWEHLSTPSVMETDKPSDQYARVQLYEKDFSPSRIAYKLNLTGTTLSLFTACSTALVAVHMACKSVLQGECDMALAGGVSVWLPQKTGYLHEQGMILSGDGYHRSFDACASGSVFSDGVGVVVVKKLSQALADGDSVHAVIKGSALNNDGDRKLGYTAVSVAGQADVIRSAMNAAGIGPEQVGYIETHGSATALGDVIEVEALQSVFSQSREKCVLGAVKTNIGHSNSASGAAGLIKTVLALKHRQLPATLHFDTPNPSIDFESSPFTINSELQPWPGSGDRKIAGVSSFGIGGTNAHVIVQQGPTIQPGTPSAGPWLITLSARSEQALALATERFCNWLDENPAAPMADVAYTLQLGRKAFEHRISLVCNSASDALEQLRSERSGRVLSGVCPAHKRQVVFMFPGQGGQYINMGRGLYEREPVFREIMDLCFDDYRDLTGNNLKVVLFPDHENRETLTDTGVSQPLLFIFEYALSRMLISKGIVPELMVGYSFGEYAAACIAGVFSVRQGLELIHIRGRLMQSLPEGRMLSTSLDREQLKSLLFGSLAIAIENPGTSIVAGLKSEIEQLEQKLRQLRCFTFPVDVTHFAHSPLLQAIESEFKRALERIDLRPPQIPYISNVTGRIVEPGQATDSAFWCQHLLQTVKFEDCLDSLLTTSDGVVLEVGPGNDLSVLLRSKLTTASTQQAVNLVGTKYERVDDTTYLLNSLGQLWLYGGLSDWSAHYSNERRLRLPLPLYAFERQLFNPPEITQVGSRPHHSGGMVDDMDQWFYQPVWQPSPARATSAYIGPEPQRILLFVDDLGVGQRLADSLIAAGQFVVQVSRGEAFSQIDELRFVLNPANPDDYQQLLQALPELEAVELHVVHLWTVTGHLPLERQSALNWGFFSNIYLSRVLAVHPGVRKIQWLMVSDRSQQVAGETDVQCEKTAILALPLVLPQEHPHILCRHIDINPMTTARGYQLINRQLLSELGDESRDKPRVAYRGNQRWAEGYEPMPAECFASSRLKRGGVYLITGGLGGVGLILAEYLAREYQAKLALISRQPSADKTAQLDVMGADFIALAADCGDEGALKSAIITVEEHFGSLDGVIHAAGLLGMEWLSPVVDTDPDGCRQQWWPKIKGIQALASVLADKPVDFVLCMSSISNVLGGLGHAAYIAGNQFMDAFVREQNQAQPSPWISVNWDGWQTESASQAGSAVTVAQDDYFMTPAQAVLAFERALAAGDTEVLVQSTGDLPTRRQQWIELSGLESAAIKRYARPNLATPFVGAETPLEIRLCEILQERLGVEKIGIHDDFFELNANSFLIVQIINQIKQQLGQDMSVLTLYKYPTIAQLSEFIGQVGGEIEGN